MYSFVNISAIFVMLALPVFGERILMFTAHEPNSGLLLEMARVLKTASNHHNNDVDFLSYQNEVQYDGFTIHLVKPSLNLSHEIGVDEDELLPIYASWCTHLGANEHLVNRLHKRNFTALVVDLFANDVCSLYLGRQLGIPVIGFWPWSMSYPLTSRMGLPESEPSSFAEEISSLFFLSSQPRNWQKYYETAEDLLLTRTETAITTKELYDDLTIILINQNAVLEDRLLSLPNIVNVGGFDCHLPQPLSVDIENFIKSFRHGIVIVSNRDFSRFRTFSKFPNTAFLFNDVSTSTTEANVKAVHVDNINDIIGHPKTRLVISSCDTSEAMTSVFHGVPLVCIPTKLREIKMAAKLVELGVAVEVKLSNFTEESLYENVKTILRNERFMSKCRQLSFMFRDELTAPADRLVYWINYVIRYKGLPEHLSSLPRKPSTKRYRADVFFTILFVIQLVMIAGMYLLYRKLRTYRLQTRVKGKHE